MVFPVLCAECGKDLGSKFEFYNAVKTLYFQKKMEKLPVRINKLNCDPDRFPPLGFIMDALDIPLLCCRKSFLGFIEFEDIA